MHRMVLPLCIRLQLRTLEYRLDKKWCPSLSQTYLSDLIDMHHLVYGNALNTQVAYLFADIVTACGMWTCDVVAGTDCAKPLSIDFVSWRISISSFLAPSCGKTGSCGSTSCTGVGSCGSVFASVY